MIVIDLLGLDEEEEKKPSIEFVDSKEEKKEIRHQRRISLQVININGEIVEI